MTKNPKDALRDAASPASLVNVKITPPDIQRAVLWLIGDTYLCVHRFSEKAMTDIRTTQEAGSKSRSRKKRDPKNFEQLFQAARHLSSEGWDGVPASAFRNAMISACRVADYKMTHAKLAVFIREDGHDQDGMPIVKIHSDDQPEMWIAPARNANGSFDLRSRPRWKPGTWRIQLHVEYDGGVFSLEDITNLLMRVGFQVGIGEGRPDSKDSAGIDYGKFHLESEADVKKGEQAA